MAKGVWLPLSSTDPVAAEARIFGPSEFAVLVASLAFGAPALLVGIDLLGGGPGLGLTVSQLILVAPLGIIFAAGLLAACAWAAAENGVPTGLLMRPALGVAGSWAAMVLQIAFLIAWIALELDFGASAFVRAMGVFGVDGIPETAVVIVLALGALGFIVAGLAWVTRIWLYRFAFWAALLLTVVLAWRFLSVADLDVLLNTTPQATRFWLGVDGVMALGVIWFPVIADTARFTDTAPAAASGAGTGFSVAALMLLLIGGLSSVTMESVAGDPAAYLVEGATSFGAVVIVGWILVAGIDQPFLLSFSGTTSLSTLNDRFGGRVQQMAFLSLAVIAALAVPRSTIRAFTELILVFVAQLLAVLLADFFLVRGRRYETDQLYDRKGAYAGVNFYGLFAVMLGAVTAIFIHPVGPDAWAAALESIIPGEASAAEAAGLPPILVSMLVSAIVYTGLGRWKIRDRVFVSRLRV